MGVMLFGTTALACGGQNITVTKGCPTCGRAAGKLLCKQGSYKHIYCTRDNQSFWIYAK